MGSKNDTLGKNSVVEDYYFVDRDKGNDRDRIFRLEREVESAKTKSSIIENELNSKAIRVIELQKECKESSKRVDSLEL